MALKETELDKYYRIPELYALSRGEFFGIGNPLQFRWAIIRGFCGETCVYFKKAGRNAPYFVKGSDFLDFIGRVEGVNRRQFEKDGQLLHK